MLSVVDFYVLAGGFCTVYRFRGFRYLGRPVASDVISSLLSCGVDVGV